MNSSNFFLQIQKALKMEINPSNTVENSSKILWVDEEAQNHAVKSYRCTFCKRGFSNAQALGGHMNIHRKDRAKLKEFDQNLLSLDISNNVVAASDDDDDGDDHRHHSLVKTSHEEEDEEEKDDRKRVSQSMKDGFSDVLKLPLFAETPSLGGGKELQGGVLMMSAETDDGDGVDLELRLGHETKP